MKTWSMRQYLIGVAAAAVAAASVLGGINVAMDPLWMFEHRHALSKFQRAYDERQQKSNHLARTDRSYDCVIVGSSRTTYVDAAHFDGLRCFNYASNSLYPFDYPGFVEFFAERMGEPKVIVIGMDFFGTRLPSKREFEQAAAYTQRAKNGRHLLSQLVSVDALRWSLTTAAYNLAHDGPSSLEPLYDADLAKRRLPVSKQWKDVEIRAQLKIYETQVYDASYRYEPSVMDHLRSLKARHGATRFVVFTAPEAPVIYRKMVQAGLFESYARMLRELVGIFGEVHDFMGFNAFTENEANFMDGLHFYPNAGNRVVDVVWNQRDGAPAFGARLRADNVEQHVARQRADVRALDVHASAENVTVGK
jgi:hypothetical protein